MQMWYRNILYILSFTIQQPLFLKYAQTGFDFYIKMKNIETNKMNSVLSDIICICMHVQLTKSHSFEYIKIQRNLNVKWIKIYKTILLSDKCNFLS